MQFDGMQSLISACNAFALHEDSNNVASQTVWKGIAFVVAKPRFVSVSKLTEPERYVGKVEGRSPSRGRALQVEH